MSPHFSSVGGRTLFTLVLGVGFGPAGALRRGCGLAALGLVGAFALAGAVHAALALALPFAGRLVIVGVLNRRKLA